MLKAASLTNVRELDLGYVVRKIFFNVNYRFLRLLFPDLLAGSIVAVETW